MRVNRTLRYGLSRTFAHGTLVCGSMVLYRYCVSFFAPPGEKCECPLGDKEINMTGKRKPYYIYSG